MEINSYIHYFGSQSNSVQNIWALLPSTAFCAAPVRGPLLSSFPSPQASPLHPHPAHLQPQIPGSSLTELIVSPIAP